MELAEIRLFEPQMAEIDLFTMPDAVGVGEPTVRKVKPYIAGHVTDGSSTFTFTVNGNESVTVPVDANGNWKWVVDGTITRISINGKSNIDKFNVFGLNDFTILGGCFYNATALKEVVFKKCDLSSITNVTSMFNQNPLQKLTLNYGFAPSNMTEFLCRVDSPSLKLDKMIFKNATTMLRAFYNSNIDEIDLSEAEKITTIESMSGGGIVYILHLPTLKNTVTITGNVFSTSLQTVTIKSLETSISFARCGQLTEQSVVNLFNAVAADGITLTFHATVYAMIQAQLDIEDSPIYNAYWNSDYDFTIISA